MGKRGPARRPTTLRLVEGARPDKVNQNEPKPRPIAPEPPEEWMEGSDQRRVWSRVLDQLDGMGIAFASDADALAVLVEAIVLHRQASQQLVGAPLTVPGAHGNRVKNPLLQIQRDAAQTIRAYGQEFGLTPSARASVRAETGTPDTSNPFAPE